MVFLGVWVKKSSLSETPFAIAAYLDSTMVKGRSSLGKLQNIKTNIQFIKVHTTYRVNT